MEPVEEMQPVVTHEQLEILSENVRQFLLGAEEELTQVKGEVEELKKQRNISSRVPRRTRSEPPRQTLPLVEGLETGGGF